jgi:HTH-type transcriptional regulator/antitoxin HigA
MTFNQEEYIRLFSEIVIKPIESDEELDRYVKLVEPYFFKCMKKELSPEEVAIYNLLTILIVEYERENYPIPDLEPLEFLKGLMELKDLKQKDLVGILGSKGVVSEVINGKREISKAQAKALGEYFKVDYKSFL